MSALAEHAINNYHNIAWEDAIVVDADPHMYRRRTLEAWHIRQEPNPMNRDRGLLPQHMIPLSEPTHHQTLINVDNVALSSLIVHLHCLSFPSRQGIVFTSGCFCVFIPAAPLLVLFATDEDYCIVVETFGIHILS